MATKSYKKVIFNHLMLLISMVSSGDLVASEAKYQCLVALHNAAARAKTSEQNDNCEGGIAEISYARAFAELAAFIEDVLAEREEQPPILNSPTVLLSTRTDLRNFSVSSPCTRLKERILAMFPELQAFKDVMFS